MNREGLTLGAVEPTEDRLVPERLIGGGPVENWLPKSEAGSKLELVGLGMWPDRDWF
jgi:hypothetical protein